MSNWKNYLCVLVIAILIQSCSSTNRRLTEEDRISQEFCSLGIVYFDTLLVDMKYLLNRYGAYAIHLEGYTLILENKQSGIYYKELYPIQDSLFWNINNNKKIFEERYPIDVQNIEDVMSFCEKWGVFEIFMRKDEREYFFRLPIGTIFYRETEPEGYTKRICDNWYFSSRK